MDQRTIEGIARRFELAKTEVQQQQQKSQKRPRQEVQDLQLQKNNGKTKDKDNEEMQATPASKKVRAFFVGYTPGAGSSGKSVDASSKKGNKDVEANDYTYSQICHPVHNNLSNVGVKLPSNHIVDNILHELFQNGDDAVHYMNGVLKKKIETWFPLDVHVPSNASSAARIKALKCHAKRCRKHMSTKQHRKSGSLDFPAEIHKFDIFEPMHEMWKSYVLKLIGSLGDMKKIAQRLLSADLHGAILRVVECKLISYTGVTGIMVRETAETFGIITRDNKFRVVPKRASVFMLQAHCWKITLCGDQLTSRNYG
ncbi:Ribonuclease p protein subunit p29 [Thalictrum thalictroides]|uniref:Ribonuclease p protein subunit p29 n=1 Tax=Thalictrum thalictroides TaxID=46969 RepID=A0A7J6WT79_THATH|nr:Ribonuclease p protein subunit p29 [Thalictrum thalictroides]